MIYFLKTNKLLHIFTNFLFCGNFYWLRGKSNRIQGLLRALFIRTNFSVKGNNNRIIFGKGCKLSRCRIFIRGDNNVIELDDLCPMDDTTLWIMGNDNTFKLSKRGYVNNAEIGLEGNNNRFLTGEFVQLGGYLQLGLHRTKTITSHFYVFEGRTLRFGANAAISDGATFRTSDSHSLMDENLIRTNHAKDITIGSNVWVCSGAIFLKGAGVGDGSVVGLNAVVTKDFSNYPRSIIAGSPAKVIKENINWSFELK